MMGLARGERLFLAVAMSAMAAMTLPWMPKLGVEYDEAHFYDSATRIVAGHPEVLRPPDGVTVAHRQFPFMTMAYVGGLDGWLLSIPMAIFGFHVMVPRVVHLLAGFVVLWLTYLLARKYGGKIAGGIAVAMIVVDLEFLLHVPVHYGPFLLQMICGTAMLLLLERWFDDGRPRDFYGACLLAGLAFQEKLTFVWILGLLTVLLLVFRRREIFARLTVRQFLIGFSIFLAAMLPVLWYALGRPEVVFGFSGSAAAKPGWETLLQRFQSFRTLLTGVDFLRLQLDTMPPFPRFSALEWLFWGSFALAVVQRNAKALTLLLFTVGLVALNALFPVGGRLHHLLLAYPLMQIGVGLAWSRWRYTSIAAAVLILATGASTAHTISWYTGEVERTGGRNNWSGSIYDVAQWMKSQPDRHYIATAWGFYRPLYFLTGGRISIHDRYHEMLPNPLDADTRTQLGYFSRRRNTYWLSSRLYSQYEDNRQKLFAIAKEQGLEPKLAREFFTRDSKPIYQVYTMRDADAEPAWKPIAGRFANAREIEVKLPPGTRDVRFRLNARKWNRALTMRVELIGPDGQWYAAWWRTLEFLALPWPDEYLAFGNDLFPDYFVPLPGTRTGEASQIRVSLETNGKPVDMVMTDLEAR